MARKKRGQTPVTSRSGVRPRNEATQRLESARVRVAPAAAVWLVIAAIHVTLGATIDGTALRSEGLGIVARVSLLALELLLLATAVGVLAAIRRALGVWSWPVIAAAILLYTVSWAAFWNAGVFLDRAAFLFWAPQPIQVLHWVYPPLIAGIFIVTAAASLLLAGVVPRLAAALPGHAQQRLVKVSGVAVIVCGLVAALGTALYGGGRQADLGQALSSFALARDQ
ncbi:MAG: hypothetical protein FJW14_13710, partial [Acidimicrobiia bacterium]|nr:hypothetical protein [Acidimicrobiia bacterium]